MKKVFLTYLVSMICCASIQAQCPQFPVVLSTQQEVDSFLTEYPGCESLTHWLSIEGSLITTLQPLLGITHVGRLDIYNATHLQSLSGLDSLRQASTLVIWNTGLLNFQGFEKLETVKLNFHIIENPQLQSLVGLDNLRSAHDFWLHKNPQLQNLAGLNNLRSVNHLWVHNNSQLISLQGLGVLNDVGVLDINDNAVLQHLAGMPVLTSIRTLIVDDNASLTNLSGLENINHITNNLYIRDNPALNSIEALYQISELRNVEIKDNPMLSSLAGLGSLTRVTDNLILSNNDAIVNLDGLSALQQVTDTFEITENGALVNLSGITSLQYVRQLTIFDNDAMISLEGAEAINSIGSINISFNEVLSSCSIASICEHLIYQREATIGDNFDGCNSQDQILAGCTVATDEDSHDRLSVYPNPTNDFINVVGMEEAVVRVEMWNTLGMRLPDMYMQSGQIDLSGLHPGLYLLRIPLSSGMRQFAISRL